MVVLAILIQVVAAASKCPWPGPVRIMVSLLQVSHNAVTLYGNPTAALQLQEGAKRRRIEVLN